jgi:hypothetical protein
MKKLPLYRYTSGNSIIDSPNKPDVEYIERARLVADEGMGLTKDDVNKYIVIDVDLDDVPNWREVEAPELYIEDEPV